MKRFVVAAVFLMFGGVVLATTWGPTEKTDPLTGGKVPAKTVRSYGGYIYEWPSKWDMVFWPLTDENWICLNPKNGYAAFNNDFEKVADAEKEHLTAWLKENYKPENAPKSHKEKLAWLEKVYGQRKMDNDFWCRFYRLMANIHSEDDEKVGLEYVRKALPLLEEKVKSATDGMDRLETIFLLGEYHRRLGDISKAQEFFAQVKDVKHKDEDGRERVAHPYFQKLVAERQKLLVQKPATQPSTGASK